MDKILETDEYYSINGGYLEKYPILLNLSKVSALTKRNGKCYVYVDGNSFRIADDCYKQVREALKSYKDNETPDRLCDLQHDHVWLVQALSNIIAMTKDASYKPAILIGCKDVELAGLYDAVHAEVRKMQGRIKELEKEVRVMTEPKYENYE